MIWCLTDEQIVPIIFINQLIGTCKKKTHNTEDKKLRRFHSKDIYLLIIKITYYAKNNFVDLSNIRY